MAAEKNTRSFAFYGNLPPRGGNSNSDDDSSTHPDHDRNATITNQVKVKLQNKKRKGVYGSEVKTYMPLLLGGMQNRFNL